MSAPIYVVLLHHPVLNRHGDEVTTAVTNMDVHDIARSARTYGAKGYFLVTPIEDQHELIGRILGHWLSDASRQYHPDRVEAVSLVRLVKSFSEVREAIRESHGGKDPEVVMTSARSIASVSQVSYEELRRELKDSERDRPCVLVFGTGWGIAESFYPEVNRVLPPIHGPEGQKGYNHLSVRSAVAIILDRLLGV